ncbi:MAG: hypothetical protein M1836_002543 [Candelina mexicana]|nr:MAG: hypothetical protein M1836_002543 [Candelina mexicana]
MGASHRSGHCPRDKEKETLLQAARAAKYQICYRCREMRELSSGCNHITCPCGAEFCYVCGGVWKHCDCPANGLNGGMPDLVPGVLLGDANQQGDQDLNAAAAPLHNQADAEQAAQAMDFEDMAAHAANPNEPILPEVDTQPRELTDAQYECHSVRRQNRHWDGVFGGSFCSFCQWISDFHIFRCRECGIQACRRCTYTAALLPVDER